MSCVWPGNKHISLQEWTPKQRQKKVTKFRTARHSGSGFTFDDEFLCRVPARVMTAMETQQDVIRILIGKTYSCCRWGAARWEVDGNCFGFSLWSCVISIYAGSAWRAASEDGFFLDRGSLIAALPGGAPHLFEELIGDHETINDFVPNFLRHNNPAVPCIGHWGIKPANVVFGQGCSADVLRLIDNFGRAAQAGIWIGGPRAFPCLEKCMNESGAGAMCWLAGRALELRGGRGQNPGAREGKMFRPRVFAMMDFSFWFLSFLCFSLVLIFSRLSLLNHRTDLLRVP